MRSPFKVIATGEAMVNHDLALQAGDRFRFVGRSPSASPFKRAKEDDPDMRALHERFPPLACEYPDDGSHRFILKALQKGDLLPCDETTAARAGVSFKRRIEPKETRASKGGE